MKNLKLAVDVANLVFFGYKVMIGDCNANRLCPAPVIRNAIKYQSLDDASQKIWDDPDMLQAHKYQNIPQIDISYYMSDYVVDGNQRYPIELHDNHVTVTYIYSATKEFFEISFGYDSPLFDKLISMGHIVQTERFITDNNIDHISSELCLLIFGADDLTDIVSEGNPQYGITVRDVYNTFSKHPHNLYVPYRRGWSRVLNIQPFEKTDDMSELAVRYNHEDVAHILGVSAITTWDGQSMKIENHGVEVEDMKVNMVYDADTMTFKMRRLEGTHEYMHDVKVTEPKVSPSEYFVIYAIKGVNINGFEFNMP